MVYVISKNGQPLMPTKRSGKVYRLLKTKQARVQEPDDSDMLSFLFQ